MNPRHSLRRKIAVAYLLFAFGSSLFFAVIAAVAVEGIEVHLVDNRLEEVAAWASPRHAGGLPVAMPAGLSFYHGDAIPQSLRNLPPGVDEIHVDGVGLHVLAGKDDLGNYVVVDHESDYEHTELLVYSMFALGFLGFLLCSMFLGRFIAGGLVTPITALATAVNAGAELPLLEREDELGVLARAFAAHTGELRGFLDRERFFTGDVSHELRTPLTIITGAAEILVEQGAQQPALAAAAERILRAAKEASARVNVLLALARSRDQIDFPETDIGIIVQAEIEQCQLLVAGRPVSLRLESGPGLRRAVPPDLCAAAIGNLIRNACQYTTEGEVLVRLTRDAVIVEDSGPGLPPAVRAALKGSAVAAPSSGAAGTGLGLALVKRICERLGARLHAVERPGGGSIFSLQFNPALTKV